MTDETARVAIVPKLIAAFDGPARYRGSRGGRGSGKTRSFATMLALKGYELAENGETGILLCARQFMNSLAESSFAEVKGAIQAEPFLNAYYECGETYIRTKCGSISLEFVGLARNLDSIKSKAKIHVCWIDEAENVTDAAWEKLLPTVREHESEVWVTWNPERERSPTNRRFWTDAHNEDGSLKDGYRIVECNWRDNPRFPAVLEFERQKDEQDNPEQYDHIWEGAYKTVVTGAYFAKQLTTAKAESRITVVPIDPLMRLYAHFDIGGTGAKADAVSIWISQRIGLQLRVVDHYTAQGQPLAAHVEWMMGRGYTPARCEVVLPHDGVQGDKVYDTSYESALRKVGYSVKVVPNMGTGAANLRIEAVRRVFPAIVFNEATTKAGREAVGWYHEKRDADRGIGLGPNHDWSSHDADAFGLMCVDYEAPRKTAGKINYSSRGIV